VSTPVKQASDAAALGSALLAGLAMGVALTLLTPPVVSWLGLVVLAGLIGRWRVAAGVLFFLVSAVSVGVLYWLLSGIE
jgi:hypothetical protein